MKEAVKQLIKSGIGWAIEIFGNTYPGRFFLEQTLGVALKKTDDSS